MVVELNEKNRGTYYIKIAMSHEIVLWIGEFKNKIKTWTVRKVHL